MSSRSISPFHGRSKSEILFELDQKGAHLISIAKEKFIRKLKIVQLVICFLQIIASAMVFFPLGSNFSKFQNQCLLYSDVRITWRPNMTVELNLALTDLNKANCDYTTFINVVVAINSILWIWFLILSKEMRSDNGSEQRLLLPSLLFHFSLFICVVVSSSEITSGNRVWCENIADNNLYKGQRLTCSEFETLDWSINRGKFYTFSILAEVSSWFLVGLLLIQCCTTGLRLYHDFIETISKNPSVRRKRKEDIENMKGFLDDGWGITNKGAEGYSSVEDELDNVSRHSVREARSPSETFTKSSLKPSLKSFVDQEDKLQVEQRRSEQVDTRKDSKGSAKLEVETQELVVATVHDSISKQTETV